MSDISKDVIENVLTHYGKKGMKWGVRAHRVGDVVVSRGLGISTTGNRARSVERAATRGPKPVVIKDKGKKLRTSGGKGFPAHPDALRARRLGQVGKKSGLKALSDDELRIYSNRLQLEQNVKRLNFNEMGRSKKFVATVLGNSGKSLASEGVNKGTKEVGKRAVRLAMTK